MPIKYIFSLALTVLILIGCSGLNYVDVPSTNQNSRVNYLVIHATSALFQESLSLLSTPNQNPVSSHYLVPTQTTQPIRGMIFVFTGLYPREEGPGMPV